MTTKPPKKPSRKNTLAAPPEKRVAKLTEGSPKAKKTAARLAAVQILYQMRLNNQDADSALREFVNHRLGFKIEGDVYVPADQELLDQIILGIQNRWMDIEEIIVAALSAGKKSEVEPLLDGILRAGTYELLENTATDTGIIINDYMNVTTGFYEGKEVKLVNAVLDKIGKTVRG